MQTQKWTSGLCGVLVGLIALGVVSVPTTARGEFVCSGYGACVGCGSSGSGTGYWSDTDLSTEWGWYIFEMYAQATSTTGALAEGVDSDSDMTSSGTIWAAAYYEWEWEGGGTPPGGDLYYNLDAYGYVYQEHHTGANEYGNDPLITTAGGFLLDVWYGDNGDYVIIWGDGGNHLYGGSYPLTTQVTNDSGAGWSGIHGGLYYLWVSWSWQDLYWSVVVDDCEYVPEGMELVRYEVATQVCSLVSAQASSDSESGASYCYGQVDAKGDAMGWCQFDPD
jgi:hypothetical protein